MTNTIQTGEISLISYCFENKEKEYRKKVIITFQKSDRIKLELSIESNKKFKELATLFFSKR